MLTDPCDCGIKPTSHAHVVNGGKDEVIFWKGAPVIIDKEMNKVTHKLEIIVTQEKLGENGAEVQLHIHGENHVLVAALAGLMKTDLRFLEMLVNAMHANEQNMVKTFANRPDGEEDQVSSARVMAKDMACAKYCGDGTGKKPEKHMIECPYWEPKWKGGDKDASN